jgi:hypothetical protein
MKSAVANYGRYFELIRETVSLLKAYVRFVRAFDRRYLPFELGRKMQLCLHVIFQAVNGGGDDIFQMLLEQAVTEELNVVLQLDDSLGRNLEEADLSPY